MNRNARSPRRSKKNPYVLVEYIDTIGNRRIKILHKDNLPTCFYRTLTCGTFNYCRQYMIDTWGYDPTEPIVETAPVLYCSK